MTEATATLLMEAAGAVGIDADHDTEYSGRGMYGDTTHAVSCSSDTELLAATAVYVADNDVDMDGVELEGFRTDSLGMGVILY